MLLDCDWTLRGLSHRLTLSMSAVRDMIPEGTRLQRKADVLVVEELFLVSGSAYKSLAAAPRS